MPRATFEPTPQEIEAKKKAAKKSASRKNETSCLGAEFMDQMSISMDNTFLIHWTKILTRQKLVKSHLCAVHHTLSCQGGRFFVMNAEKLTVTN